MKYIKYFKLLEHNIGVNISPKVGYYIISKYSGDYVSDNVTSFLNNNIGKIIKIDLSSQPILVEYENEIPGYEDWMNKNKLFRYSWWFNEDEIKYISKTKEDLLPYIQAKKYNI